MTKSLTKEDHVNELKTIQILLRRAQVIQLKRTDTNSFKFQDDPE